MWIHIYLPNNIKVVVKNPDVCDLWQSWLKQNES